MLHTFWPEGAVRAFREVIRIESTCAMGYWGLYQGIHGEKRDKDNGTDILSSVPMELWLLYSEGSKSRFGIPIHRRRITT